MVRLIEEKEREALAAKIAEKKGLDVDKVKKMLHLNILTYKQFSELSGLKEGSIENKGRPRNVAGEWVSDLDVVFPFPSLDSRGPKFVILNEKSRAYLV